MFKFLRRWLATPPTATTSIDTVKKESLENHLELANRAVNTGEFELAVHHYELHVHIFPQHHGAHIGLGFSLLHTGNREGALNVLQRAKQLNPLSPDGLYLLGKAHLDCRNEEFALAEWTALQHKFPDFEPVYLDLCRLLFNLGRSANAENLIRQGIEKFPTVGEFWFYLGNLEAERGEYLKAFASYSKAIHYGAQTAEIFSNLATTLMQIGDVSEALSALEKSLELDPLSPATYSNYLLCLQYSKDHTPHQRFAAACEFSRRFEHHLEADSLASRPQPRELIDRLRVGYVSGDFRNHSLAFFITPILRHHDHQRFEIFAYHAHPGHDEFTEQIRRLCDHWRPCHTLSDDALAACIRADGIDVLIDLSGHTGYNRMLTFARRPAPLQMTWLGYLATTGLNAMDYRITDEGLDPTGTTEKFHSERLLRLSSSATFGPHPNAPRVNELPVLSVSTFTFACLNNPSKITLEAADLWAQILEKCPGSRLLIGNSSQTLVQWLTPIFTARNIGAERLCFEPKLTLDAYLALHHHVDLALDTFPYNGGTTTFHSLWMGVPIIALEGDAPMSRVGVSILRGLDLLDFRASTFEEYVQRAVYHFEHREELAKTRRSVRARLAQQSEHLAQSITKELETSITSIWAERHGHSSDAGAAGSISSSSSGGA